VELNVLNQTGAKAKNIDVSDKVFGVDFNEALVHQVVTAYLAGGRSGTRAQKNRSAVSGGGAKPWRQKGTGRARAGTIRSPIWRSGGVTFPSASQDFSQKVNKKMYRGALRSILSELVRKDRLVTIDSMDFPAPKTRVLAEKLKRLEMDDVLIVDAEVEDGLMLSARNIPHVDVCAVKDLNPVRLLSHEKVLITSAAAEKIQGWLGE